ncbi:Ankyrin repeat-containing protein [Cladophialophora immunda]|nr:Ankyrin repeat-containing protein [Cladophialophora immunda]
MRDDFRTEMTRIRAEITRNVDMVNAHVRALDQRLRIISQSVSTAEGYPIVLRQQFHAIDVKLNALNDDSITAQGKLDRISHALTATNDASTLAGCVNVVKRSLTAANGNPIILHEQLDPISQALTNSDDPHTVTARLETVTRSLTAADGNPVLLRESLDTINRALTNHDDVTTVAGRLKVVKRSLTPANGNPIILYERLDAIHRVLTDWADTNTMAGRLETVRQSLTTADGNPVSLYNIDRRVTTVTRVLMDEDEGLMARFNTIRQTLADPGDPTTVAGRLETVRRSVTTADGNPVILHERLDTISEELTNRDAVDTVAGRLEWVGRILTTEDGEPILLQQYHHDTRRRLEEVFRPLQTELRAGHFNSAARAVNAKITCCTTPIYPFHGVNNQRIPGFPPTYLHLKGLNEDLLNRILESLGLSTAGTLGQKRKRLMWRQQASRRGKTCMAKEMYTLGPLDFEELHNFHRYRIRSDEPPSVLSSAPFRTWFGERKKIFWCCGIAGSGKTTTCVKTIEHIHQEYGDKGDVGVAAAYLERDCTKVLTPVNVVGSLWRQLMGSRAPISDRVADIFNENRPDSKQPGIEEMTELLKEKLSSFDRCFIIIDGLDGYYDSEAEQILLLETLFALIDHVNIPVTSDRTDREEMSEGLHFTVTVQAREVEEMVHGELTSLSQDQLLSWSVNDAASKISKATGNCWLLANLRLDRIRSVNSAAEGDVILHDPPQTLPEAHLKATASVKEQPLARQQMASKDLKAACAHLTLVDEDRDVIRFIHPSTRSFISSSSLVGSTDANLALAQDCLEYLLHPQFEDPFQLRKSQMRVTVKRYPFLAYAAMCWAEHCCKAEARSSSLDDNIAELLNDPPKVAFLLDVVDFCKVGGGRGAADMARGASGLWIAASCGLEVVVQKLLDLGAEVDAKDTSPKLSPPEQAVRREHFGTTSLLVEAGAAATGIDLHFAAYHGQAKLVHRMLERGAPANVRPSGSTRWNPVEVALLHEHTETASVLFDFGAKFQGPIQFIDMWDMMLPTVLNAACRHIVEPDVARRPVNATQLIPFCIRKKYDFNEDAIELTAELESIIHILTANGADFNAPVEETMPLPMAVAKESEGLVKLLLLKGADPNGRGWQGLTVLHEAVQKKNAEIVEMLLDHKARPNVVDHHGHASLHDAIASGLSEIAIQLLKKGASPAVRERWGKIAMSECHGKVNAEAMELLRSSVTQYEEGETEWHRVVTQLKSTTALEKLQRCPDANVKSSYGESLLYRAADKGRTAIREILLFKQAEVDTGRVDVAKPLLTWGANVDHIDYYGMTALHRAAPGGRKAVTKLLLQQKADFKIEDGKGFTAPRLAAMRGHLSVVKLIVEEDGDAATVVVRQADTRTSCLHVAAEHSHGGIVRWLMKLGCPPDTEESGGFTPLGYVSIVCTLLDHGADVLGKGGIMGPLYMAIDHGRTDADAETSTLVVCQTLLERGADVHQSSLFGSRGRKWRKGVEGENVSIGRWLSQGPVAKAAGKGDTAMVRLLLDSGFTADDVNPHSGSADTGLSAAAAAGSHVDVLKLLLSRGADVNALQGGGEGSAGGIEAAVGGRGDGIWIATWSRMGRR